MKTFFKLLWQDTEGQDLVEYALMVGMVAVAAVAAMPSLTGTLSTVFSKIGSTVTAQVPVTRIRGAGANAIPHCPVKTSSARCGLLYRQCSLVYARCRHGVHQNQPCSVLH